MGLGGLFLLNLLFLVAGSGILWGIRGWSSWGDWLALSGVAYMLGLGSSVVVLTLNLVYGGGASTAEVLLAVLGLALLGAATGVLLGRPRPARGSGRRPRTRADWMAIALGLATAALLGGFFRQARVDPLHDWDAWAFWIPKAKIVYFFGTIDTPVFRSLAGASYPLFVPTLDAMDFRFIGSANTTLLAVQDWLLLVGFVAAMVGLLRSLAPQWLVWLFAGSAVVLPQLDARLLHRIGDWPLDIFFCLASLALARWILTHDSWALVAFGILLTSTLATKREGQLLAACLIAAGIVALGWRGRRDWALLVGTAATAFVLNLPWRLWWTSRGLTPDTPEGGVLSGTLHLSRVAASFRLVLRLLFDFGMWNAALPIALAAALLALWRPDRRMAVLFLATVGLGVVGWAWVNWSDPSLVLTSDDALNPTDRAVGSLALLSLALAPLLLTPQPREEAAPLPAIDVLALRAPPRQTA